MESWFFVEDTGSETAQIPSHQNSADSMTNMSLTKAVSLLVELNRVNVDPDIWIVKQSLTKKICMDNGKHNTREAPQINRCAGEGNFTTF